jgi:transcriptional regulator of acetoin/glycerol metabolism
MIQPYHFPPAVHQTQPLVRNNKKSPLIRKELKKKELIEALESTGGNQSRAAEILGISRVTVWNRMKRYGIAAPSRIKS